MPFGGVEDGLGRKGGNALRDLGEGAKMNYR